LDVARMEAGKMLLDLEECQLSDVFSRSINAVKGFAEKKNITLAADPTRLKIMADGARVTQVIVNLLSNGVKFSGENTTVRVSVQEHEDATEIRVCDQGPGVPTDQRQLIFERFERAGNKKSGIEGTGLGLAICKSIVDAHHGAIGIDENPGGGAVFWFRIPKLPVEVSAKK
jgi:signal transduction histidine kinase